MPAISVLINYLYETLSYLNFDGQTLGKFLFSCRVVRDDGLPLDLQSASIMFGGKLLNLFVFADVIYGLLNVAGDNKCLHNVLSGTTVVRKVPAVVEA